jgi:PAS domain S-box-containing protein
MGSAAEHYLKRELYALVRADSSVFDFLQDGSLDGIWYWDIEHPEHAWLSRRFKELLGYKDDELDHTVTGWQSRIFSEDLPNVLENFRKHCEDARTPYDQLVRYRHRGGSTIWLRSRGIATRDSGGRAIRMLGAHTDVTSLQLARLAKEQDDSARALELRFEELTDCLQGMCDYLSKQWSQYIGVPNEQLLRDRWLDFVHPDDRSAVQRGWQESLSDGRAFHVEFRMRRHDGAYGWFESHGLPLRDAQARIIKWCGTNTDLTERRQVANALRSSEHHLQTVLANMTEGVVLADLDGRLLHWNRAALEMHGFTSLQETHMDLTQLDELFELSAVDGTRLGLEHWPMSRLLRGEPVCDVELRLRHRTGGWERVCSYNGGVVWGADGAPLAFTTITDLTARKRALAELEANEERLRLANEAAGIGTYALDLVTGTMDHSPELSELLGLTQEVLQPDVTARSVHPDDLPRAKQAVERANDPNGDGYGQFEVRVIRPGGDVRWTSWSVRTVFRDTLSGRVAVKRMGACFDITELRRAERRLATQNRVSRALADATTLSSATPRVLAALCEAEDWDFGTIWQVNPSAGVMYGVDVWHRPELGLDALASQTRQLTITKNDVSLPARVWANAGPLLIDLEQDAGYVRKALALQMGLRKALAFPIVLRGEVTGVIDFLGRSIHSADDKLYDMFDAIGRQLGEFFERKRLEQALRERETRRTHELETALAELEAFSYSVSHDLKAPLRHISGNAELMQRRSSASLDERSRQYLQTIASSARNMNDIIDGLLSLSGVGRVELRKERVDLSALVQAAREEVQRDIAPRAVVWRVDPLPYVIGDTRLLRQVLINVLGNALKFTRARDPARIEIGLHPSAFGYVTVFVRDNGTGFDSELAAKLFRPFQRLHHAEQFEGHGIGLALVKRIIERHGGRVWLEGHVDHGATVYLSLPEHRPT